MPPRHARLREELLNLVVAVGPQGVRVIDRGQVHHDHGVAVRGVCASLAVQGGGLFLTYKRGYEQQQHWAASRIGGKRRTPCSALATLATGTSGAGRSDESGSPVGPRTSSSASHAVGVAEAHDRVCGRHCFSAW